MKQKPKFKEGQIVRVKLTGARVMVLKSYIRAIPLCYLVRMKKYDQRNFNEFELEEISDNKTFTFSVPGVCSCCGGSFTNDYWYCPYCGQLLNKWSGSSGSAK